jgi:hypothetical protein
MKTEDCEEGSSYIWVSMAYKLSSSLFKRSQDKVLDAFTIHSINTRNKHHLHRPIANLSCFQKSTFYSSIRIFNSLPCNIKNLKNEKAQFKAALRRYLNVHSFYSVDEFFMSTVNL